MGTLSSAIKGGTVLIYIEMEFSFELIKALRNILKNHRKIGKSD